MNWFLGLEPEDQEFVKQLVLASGSLKRLAAVYQVSYPTVRLRLDKTIQKIRLIEQSHSDGFETKIMQLVIDDKLSLDLAKQIIDDYREEHDE